MIVTYTDSHFVAKHGIGAMACSRTVHGAVPSCCRYSLSGRAAAANATAATASASATAATAGSDTAASATAAATAATPVNHKAV